MMEMGYLLGKGKIIKFMEEPTEKWVKTAVEYLEKQIDIAPKKNI